MAALALPLTSCGSGSTPHHAATITPSESNPQETPPAPASTDMSSLKAASTNLLMRNTSFHASGTTTAFEGSRTEMWSVPGQGLHIHTTNSQTGKNGDIFCKDGATYTSAPLFADSLKQSGTASITVPPDLTDVYVKSEMPQGCASMYSIPENAKLTPEQDSSVNGAKSYGLTASNALTSDVYQVAAEGRSYLLQLGSTRDGRSSITTYDSFGEKFTVTLPPMDKTMPLKDFRNRVTGH
ncbi:hypothetical protein [Streptomyces sp. NPDC037389]|uniref:hypothetical protein n=1 Tax=Streptomyces sp. NPDC037389 TaxID=3155369 RepID=UPI0033DBD090